MKYAAVAAAFFFFVFPQIMTGKGKQVFQQVGQSIEHYALINALINALISDITKPHTCAGNTNNLLKKRLLTAVGAVTQVEHFKVTSNPKTLKTMIQQDREENKTSLCVWSRLMTDCPTKT